jgi:hypothetical protein
MTGRQRSGIALALVGAVLSGSPLPAHGSDPASRYLKADISDDRSTLLFLGVDSLGKGEVRTNLLRRVQTLGRSNEGWTVEAADREVRLASSRTAARFSLTIDTHVCHATLLGRFDSPGRILLPAVLHLPGFGTLRLTADASGVGVSYDAAPGWIRVDFPPASEAAAPVRYRMEVAEIHPEIPGISGDPRFDGFRRNWLNALQLNPNRGVLSNNTASDTCGFCYYEYADIARQTPPLAVGLRALDVVRQTLDHVLAGMLTAGMPGYGGPGNKGYAEETADTAPSILIAADDVMEGLGDDAWLRAHYAGLRAIADRMLATDRSGDGLVKYAASGNSGSWNEGIPDVRPSNWWDTIGFGYEDAYANALAYRALGGMSRMAGIDRDAEDSARYAAAARRLRGAYFPAFYNPGTGILAGWRSADGVLHDYGFIFVNAIAVAYGLVPEARSQDIVDRIWALMAEKGYSRFRMGLPGNLISVARSDYAHKEPRYGGGRREDNADGFQVYENGGATACFAYFMVAALNEVGEPGRRDQILLPLLDAYEKREFEGDGPNGMTNDWRKWDGASEGYEGYLADNYYALLAVPERR